MTDNKDRGDYVQLVGGVTRDPEIFSTRIGDALKFPLAVRTGWGKDDTKFVKVTVFNSGLIARKSEIYKGAQGVAVEGYLANKPYNGKDSWEIVADKLGLTEWFAATRKGQSAPAVAEEDTTYANV